MQAGAPRSYEVTDPDARSRLHALLASSGATPMNPAMNEAWRMRLEEDGSSALVIMYQSGRCVVPIAPPPAFDDAVTLVERALDSAPTNRAQAVTYDPSAPHIGTDEAGKGDYFGPLVSAAVFVDAGTSDQLLAAGVRDSKKVADSKIPVLASTIRSLTRGRFAVTQIYPRKYNQLYRTMQAEGKNLNTLLAWGHARSIEDLTKKGVPAVYVLVDQFADTKYIDDKLLRTTRERQLPIIQFPRAESDIAVAAASILARERFLAWISRESARLGVTIPRGASDAVIVTARDLVMVHGTDILEATVKTSFRTTEKVLPSTG